MRALVRVDPDDQLRARALERDVAPLRERQLEAQRRAVAAELEPLGDRVVQQRVGGRPVLGEQRLAQAVEHARADDLLLEVRRLEHRDRREAVADGLELSALAVAPGAEVLADLGAGKTRLTTTASVRYPYRLR